MTINPTHLITKTLTNTHFIEWFPLKKSSTSSPSTTKLDLPTINKWLASSTNKRFKSPTQTSSKTLKRTKWLSQKLSLKLDFASPDNPEKSLWPKRMRRSGQLQSQSFQNTKLTQTVSTIGVLIMIGSTAEFQTLSRMSTCF